MPVSFAKKSLVSSIGCVEAYKAVVGKLSEHGYTVFSLPSTEVIETIFVLNLDTGYSLGYCILRHASPPYSLRVNIINMNNFEIKPFAGEDLEKVLADAGLEPLEQAEDKK